MKSKTMSLLEHLQELRSALLRCFVATVVACGICLPFAKDILEWLKKPLARFLPANANFAFSGAFEVYAVYFQVSFTAGFFLALPWIFYFLWRFLRPGLKDSEARVLLILALGCAALFVGGALFGYFVVFPPGFEFAVKLAESPQTILLPKMSDYVTLMLRLLLAFGICFELPLFLILLAKLRVVRLATLRRVRRYVVVAAFLLAGILTPGYDVLTQTLLALPLIALYELGLVVIWLSGSRDPASSEK